MAHYLKRSFICERLRLNYNTSFKIIGSAYGSRISSDDVIAILNRAMRKTKDPYDAFIPPKPLDYIPSDLLTPDELATELTESQITAHDLKNWCKRKKNIPPHFRLTRCKILFSRKDFMNWIDSRSRLKSLKVRKA